ncbi:response regulator [Salinisphaera sp.]|uniref:response regulator n=1 Tax=Salinisphaera sp. TaxID=1914330 RepID=UPI000C4B13D8|nr:response regulator [Salinisphaera sp.]MBS62967.1 hypothetical protein [Salinisphaera sp.]
MRILLIEDDPILGDGLQVGLQQAGYSVDWLADGALAADALANDEFDAVILDLALPSRSGRQLLADWRDAGQTVPILVLTAYDALDDRIDGLDGGADDYLVKPVALEELAARLRALVRRSQGQADNCLRWDGIEFNRASGILSIDGQVLDLSAHERQIITALLERPGQTLTREQLASRLYGWDGGPESNSLEVHIHNLRRKLGRQRIKTVRGLGYRMAQPDR